MIRPFTFVTLMLACTSGAYLFVVKHRAAGLDTQISSITGKIRSAEQRIRVLQAEWALENDPSQLAALSKQFLRLKPMEPGQMTTLGRLAEILPPPGAGLPHLPLPPPPSWAITPAAPTGGTLVNGGAGGLVASAAPVMLVPAIHAPAVTATALMAPPMPPPMKIAPMKLAPVQLAAVQLAAARAPLIRPALAQTKHLSVSVLAVHHALKTPNHMTTPLQHPVHYAARHAAHQLAAERGPLRMTPRLASAQSYNNQTYGGQTYRAPAYPRQSGGAQSVFGSLGADLPPPQPVLRSPQ
jgi:hypothetical protein